MPTRAVLLSLGPISIHWYGVMYAASFLLGAYLLPKLLSYRSLCLSRRQLDSLVLWVISGVVIGGRLGYVILYAPGYFFDHPLEIFAVWNGGMSSHGGFAGVILSLILFSKRNSVPLLALADCIVIPTAIGLAFGRMGNFINGELYGIVSSLPWAMEFPGALGLRHPLQLYAVLKNLSIAGLCFLFLRSAGKEYPGKVSALFLILYSISRFALEFLRQQQYSSLSLGNLVLSRGQIYTIPLFILGLGLWIFVHRARGAHAVLSLAHSRGSDPSPSSS